MQKLNFKELILTVECSIADLMKKLNQAPAKIIFIVDRVGKLQGTVTDGDIRRGILKGYTISDSVSTVMNKSPIFCQRGENEYNARNILESEQIKILPVLDSKGVVVDVHSLEEYSQVQEITTPVIIMAGGRGERLLPLTEDIPKPLLTVGSKPILETILESLIGHGFKNFYFSVNYKSEAIKNFFQDGKKWGVDIHYLEERASLGTIGCLSLIKERIDQPILVMNGDLLTKVDFSSLISFHKEHNSAATVCVREHYYQIPYGVITFNGLKVIDIVEKPIKSTFVNAGIYVLDPKCISYVSQDTYIDMPALLKTVLDNKGHIYSFPIHEYWKDIGRLEDFQAAQNDFQTHF